MFNAVAAACVLVSVSLGQLVTQPAVSQVLSEDVKQLQLQVGDLQTQVQKLTTSLALLQVEDTNQKNDIKVIQDDLQTSQCQNGTVDVGGWSPVANGTSRIQFRRQTVYFAQQYKRNPVISLGATALDVSYGRNTRVKCYTTVVKPSEFEITCYIWDDTNLNYVTVSWMACQNGTVDLVGWSTVVKGTGRNDYRNQTVYFDQPYKRNPVIALGIVGLDVSYDRNTRVKCSPTEVKPSEFEITCSIWEDTNLFLVTVSWMAC